MKALEIIAKDPEDAYAILGEYAGVYGDNGGDPDGNALLPSEPDSIPLELERAVVAAGLGRIVEVRLATDATMFGHFGQPHLAAAYADADPDEQDRMIEDLLATARDRLAIWSYYSGYESPSGSGRWVFAASE